MISDDDDDYEVPFQSHSSTSIEAAEKIKPSRIRGQERWIYESLRREPKADWELWNEADEMHHGLFDNDSSSQRARIQLVWISGSKLVTQWHPIEDSGDEVVNPETGAGCKIWQFKEEYRNMPYNEWVTNCKCHIPKRKPKKKVKEPSLRDLYYPLFEDAP
jgi:hypothetical protein